jgi:hypothetical protein
MVCSLVGPRSKPRSLSAAMLLVFQAPAGQREREKELRARETSATLVFVKPIGRLIAAFLLVIWVPATLQCHLETAFAVESNECCGEHSQSSGNQDAPVSACCNLASGSFQKGDAPVLVCPPAFTVLPENEAGRCEPAAGNHSPAEFQSACASYRLLHRAFPVRAPTVRA